ncbi:MAG: DNA repair protein RadC [Saprospiraceae bacterium]|nr:DNA repair protein RadC [Saprospiraceae bacterium]
MLRALQLSDSTTKKMPVKAWAEENRPREKMLIHGNDVLSDADLIAILIGSGTVDVNAVELAEQILLSVDGNLSELGRRSVKDLMKFKGIGEAKAVTIVAALEFGRRRQFSDVLKRENIRNAADIFTFMLPTMIDLPHEEFWIILLNQAKDVISKHRISTGGVTGVMIDAKMVFRPALEALAPNLILVHNHPSGQLKPSKQDIDLTHKLRFAGKTLDIIVVDHVIITRSGYFSFSDENLLN